MEDKIYPIESSALTYKMGFEGDVVYCHMIRRLKECRIDQISRVVLKKPPIGLGDEVQFRIFFIEEGKEKKFQWIPAKIHNPTTAQFLEDLKSRLPAGIPWDDLREAIVAPVKDGQKVYDLQYLLMGYAGSGLPRKVQIWMYLIGFAVLILPLYYYIWILATGGYRVYISDAGVRVRKFRDSIFPYDTLDVKFQKVNVRNNYVTTTQVMNVWFSRPGKKKKVVMRFDQARLLLQELVERKVLGEEVLADFV